MKISSKNIPEVLVFEPTVYADDRGYFMETFRAAHFLENGLLGEFVQENQSRSSKGTLRGLHYQLELPQGKLARVVSGEIFDVAVDLRQSSQTFGLWVGEILSSENKKQLWIPPGFAHGFLVLSDSAELIYKCTEYYHPEDEHSLLWSDHTLAIAWPDLDLEPLLSKKDMNAKTLKEAKVYT
tara:strand:- start:349 stop:894 length:546 start_codon:yes stop_codon:yes gene_type:complete